MISGIFHQGSGLGNQLHRYVMTRVLAEDKGYEWGMKNPHLFKGMSFMDLKIYPYTRHDTEFEEKKVLENGVDIRGYDPEINFVQDNTLIDGEFQDERYFFHRLDDIRKWLSVAPMQLPDNLCVIGFRGGEYTLFRDLYLTKSYWEKAIARKRAYEPNMAFEVHTDDVQAAQMMLGGLLPSTTPYIHDIGTNWRAVRYARELIIANSSFFIFPSLLNENVREVLAPRYWARYSTLTWALPQNYYSRFKYIHNLQ